MTDRDSMSIESSLRTSMKRDDCSIKAQLSMRSTMRCSILDFLSVRSHSSMKWASTSDQRQGRSCTKRLVSDLLHHLPCRQLWLQDDTDAKRRKASTSTT